MAERNEEKPRTCQVCGREFVTTAESIKAHAVVCKTQNEAAAEVKNAQV